MTLVVVLGVVLGTIMRIPVGNDDSCGDGSAEGWSEDSIEGITVGCSENSFKGNDEGL